MKKIKNSFKTLFCCFLIIFLVGCSNPIAHKHTFSEATCTDPKVCSECGKTEGEPLGHTVDIGLCSRCGQIVNEQVGLDIINADSKIIDLNNKVNEYIESSNYYNAYSKYTSAYNEILNVKKYLEEIIIICSDYKELSDLKLKTQQVIDNIPTKVLSSSTDDLIKFLEEYKSYLYALKDFYGEMLNVTNLFTKDNNSSNSNNGI